MMAISRQAYFPSLVMTVALIVGSAPAAYTQGPEVYEFCNSREIIVSVRDDSSPFLIQSPSFGRDFYPDNANCILTITSEQNPLVLNYEFGHFDVEYQQFCSYDSLTVNGVNYCGTWESQRIFPNFLPEWSSTVLRFKTNSRIRRTGFQIIVTPELAVNHPDSVEREENITQIPRRGGPAGK